MIEPEEAVESKSAAVESIARLNEAIEELSHLSVEDIESGEDQPDLETGCLSCS